MSDNPPVDVLIGADSLASRRSGVGRMTFEITRAARMAAGVGRVDLLIGGRVQPGDILDALGEAEAATGPAPNWKGRLAALPGMGGLRAARQAWLTHQIMQAAGGRDRLVYYEPNMIARRLPLPTVVTINDLSWHHEPRWHPADRLAWIDRNLAATLAQARRITALSQFTKDSAAAGLGIPPDRIDVVPLAPAAAFQPASAEAAAPALAQFGLADRSYVLSISTIEPRKNFDRLFAAHQALPPSVRQSTPLVIAGGKGWGSVLAAGTEAAQRRGELRLLGHVADDALVALTARAAVFAYVSLYEGFGLPVIEAMAAGCAVVASGTTSIPEVAGEAGLLVDPLDVVAISAGLQAVLLDPACASHLRQAGLSRAASFSWDRTVAGLLAAWRRALAE